VDHCSPLIFAGVLWWLANVRDRNCRVACGQLHHQRLELADLLADIGAIYRSAFVRLSASHRREPIAGPALALGAWPGQAGKSSAERRTGHKRRF